MFSNIDSRVRNYALLYINLKDYDEEQMNIDLSNYKRIKAAIESRKEPNIIEEEESITPPAPEIIEVVDFDEGRYRRNSNRNRKINNHYEKHYNSIYIINECKHFCSKPN